MEHGLFFYITAASPASDLNISPSRHLDPESAVSHHIVLHNLPVPGEADAMAAVSINAITTELHAAVPLHRDPTAGVFHDAVCHQSGQLTALQQGDAHAPVTAHQVGKHVERLAAFHIQTDCCGKEDTHGQDMRHSRGSSDQIVDWEGDGWLSEDAVWLRGGTSSGPNRPNSTIPERSDLLRSDHLTRRRPPAIDLQL